MRRRPGRLRLPLLPGQGGARRGPGPALLGRVRGPRRAPSPRPTSATRSPIPPAPRWSAGRRLPRPPRVPGPVVRRAAHRARARRHPADAEAIARLGASGSSPCTGPTPTPADRDAAARMVVIAGDGLLREAFRSAPDGDRWLLAESRAMLDAYVAARLGPGPAMTAAAPVIRPASRPCLLTLLAAAERRRQPRRRVGVRARLHPRLPGPPPRRRRPRVRGHLRQPAGRHAALARVPVLGRRACRCAASPSPARTSPSPTASRSRPTTPRAACCCSTSTSGRILRLDPSTGRPDAVRARARPAAVLGRRRPGTPCSPALIDQAPMPDYAAWGPDGSPVRHRLPAGGHLAHRRRAAAPRRSGWPTAAWTAARSGPPAS